MLSLVKKVPCNPLGRKCSISVDEGLTRPSRHIYPNDIPNHELRRVRIWASRTRDDLDRFNELSPICECCDRVRPTHDIELFRSG